MWVLGCNLYTDIVYIFLQLLCVSAKALSTVASTASFDKNPQSKERGITLDLGFSSFSIPIPSHLSGADSSSTGSTRYESVQFTLVDCPGHASLIRTIIGGTYSSVSLTPWALFLASHQALPLARKFQFARRKGESLVHFDHMLVVVGRG